MLSKWNTNYKWVPLVCFDLLLTPFPQLFSLALLNDLIDILPRIDLLHSPPWYDVRTLVGLHYLLAQTCK